MEASEFFCKKKYIPFLILFLFTGTLCSQVDTIAVTSFDVPLNIPPTGSGGSNCSSGLTIAEVFVSEFGTIGDDVHINFVKINIAHTFIGDLTLTLQSPSGKEWTLSDRNGSSTDEYTETFFVDGEQSISLGSPPYTGNYQAQEGPLSSGFNAEEIRGFWRLIVCDNAFLDHGSLNEFTLGFTLMSSQATKYDLNNVILNSSSDGSQLGNDVDIYGEWAIAGMPSRGRYSGKAILYKLNSALNEWNEFKILESRNPCIDDQFGQKVAISENYLAILNQYEKSVEVYLKENNDWIFDEKLSFATVGDVKSIDLDGRNLLIGYKSSIPYITLSPYQIYDEPDKLDVYVKGEFPSDPWNLQQSLYSENPSISDDFGRSFDISGDRMIVGAPNERGSDNWPSGAAYIFHKNHLGNWVQKQKLVKDFGYRGQEWFGSNVAIDESGVAVVGTQYVYEDYSSNLSGINEGGAIHIFSEDDMGGDTWQRVKYYQPYTRHSRREDSNFGSEVAIYKNHFAVTQDPCCDPTKLFIFRLNENDLSDFFLISQHEEPRQGFLNSVSIQGDWAIYGEPSPSYGPDSRGRILFFGEPCPNQIECKNIEIILQSECENLNLDEDDLVDKNCLNLELLAVPSALKCSDIGVYNIDVIHADTTVCSSTVNVIDPLGLTKIDTVREIVPGSSTGSFQITDAGTATYTVPIQVSPGTGGIQPKLGISYSSSGMNGVMGIGWSLSGLQQITRIGKQIDPDGYNQTIQFDRTDHFALNGERLVTIEANDPTGIQGFYGRDGTEYRAEANNMSKIVSHGEEESGPDYFTVQTKDGLILEFGNSVDSKIEVPGSTETLYWNLNKVSDQFGNFMTYHYNENNNRGEFLIDKIEYTGNVEQGLVPFASLKFTYEYRPDTLPQYHLGYKLNSNKRLKAITNKVGNDNVRTYILDYGITDVSKSSQLKSIQECGKNGSCFNPTIFEYLTQTADASRYVTGCPESSSIHPCEFQSNFWEGQVADFYDKRIVLTGDFDYNGLSDYFTYDPKTGDNRIFTTTPNVYTRKISNVEDPIDKSLLNENNDYALNIIDFNSDGFADIFLTSPSKVTHYIYLNNRDGNFTQITNPLGTRNTHTTNETPNNYFFSDINGDGLIDVSIRNNTLNKLVFFKNNLDQNGSPILNFANQYNIGSFEILDFPNSDSFSIQYHDLNGDNLPELICYDKDVNVTERLFIYRNNSDNSSSFDFDLVPANFDIDVNYSSLTNLMISNVNGDTHPDLIFHNDDNSDIRIAINRGNYTFFEKRLKHLDCNNIQDGSFFFADLNGDGIADFVFRDTSFNTISIQFNNGNLDFSEYRDVIVFRNMKEPNFVKGEFGLSTSNIDLIAFNRRTDNSQQKGIVYRARIKDVTYTKLNKITNGFGNITTIDYKTLLDPSVYAKPANSSYPNFEYIGKYHVVSSVRSSGNPYMDYFYFSGRMDMCGRGFRGFERVHIRNRSTGIVNCNHYWQDYRHATSAKKGSTTSYNRCGLSALSTCESLYSKVSYSSTYLNADCTEKVFNYNNIDPNNLPPSTTYWFSGITEKVMDSYDTDHSYIGKIKKRYKYHPYTGDMIYSVNDYGDGHIDSIYHHYTNNYEKWHLGRITKSEIYKITPYNDVYKKEVAFEYDDNSGQIIKEIMNPELSAENQIVKTYDYDGYGNITKSSTSFYSRGQLITRSLYSSYSQNGRFNISNSNDLNHTDSLIYDTLSGLVIKNIDINGNESSMEYDDVYRDIKSILPDGREEYKSYHFPNEDEVNIAENYDVRFEDAVFYTKDSSNYSNSSRTYYDVTSRELVSETYDFHQRRIGVGKKFNSSSGFLNYVTEPLEYGNTGRRSEMRFDAMGRETSTILASGKDYKMDYDGYNMTTTNMDDRTHFTKNDKLGRVIEVINNYEYSNIFYQYDAAGNMTTIIDPNANEIVMTYDIHNNQTSLTDPDFGTYSYEYNSIGELLSVTSPKGDKTEYEYDILGRITKRTAPDDLTTWVYDASDNGLGQVRKITSQEDSYIFSYDSLSRPSSLIHQIGMQTYEFKYSYDSLGRQNSIEYPNGYKVGYDYDDQGYNNRVYDVSDNSTIWMLDSVDVKGQVTKYTLGNGVTTKYQYDKVLDHLLSINSTVGNIPLQDLHYTYTNEGNLLTRNDSLRQVHESFKYDWADRLTHAHTEGVDTMIMVYDLLGNIIYKTDVGRYNYGENGKGPKTLTSIDGPCGADCIPSFQVNYTYNSYNKVTAVSNDTAAMAFVYGHSRNRIKQTKQLLMNQFETKYFIGDGLYEVVENSEGTTEICYVRVPGMGVVAMNTKTNQNPDKITYWHKDNLGSIYATTDENGSLVSQLSFDVWGKRRNLDGAPLIVHNTDVTRRGYTGHEHMDLFSLVNMNGRIYDPTIGRFISPDPFIQDPQNLQNLNRYAYVLNNPLKYTDPSGYFFKKLFKSIGKFIQKNIIDPIDDYAEWYFDEFLDDVLTTYNDLGKDVFGEDTWNTIVVVGVTIAVTAATGGAGTGFAGFIASVVSGAAGGFAGSYVGTFSATDGDWNAAYGAGRQGALNGAVSGGLAYGVGSAANAASKGLKGFSQQAVKYGVKTVGHGTAQGVMAEWQGGKFKHGLASGITSSFAGGSTGGMAGDLIVGAAIGGLSSDLGGGSFTNGAVSGIMNVAYNYHKHANGPNGAGSGGRGKPEPEYLIPQEDFYNAMSNTMSKQLDAIPEFWNFGINRANNVFDIATGGVGGLIMGQTLNMPGPFTPLKVPIPSESKSK